PGWFAEIWGVAHPTILPQALLDAELREYIKEYGLEQGQSFFEQEYHCSFDAAILGAVYGAAMSRAQKTGRIIKDIYDPKLPVHTAWELGFDDSTAIWFRQDRRRERCFSDYYRAY